MHAAGLDFEEFASAIAGEGDRMMGGVSPQHVPPPRCVASTASISPPCHCCLPPEHPNNMADAALREVFAYVDGDGDGRVCLREFEAFLLADSRSLDAAL